MTGEKVFLIRERLSLTRKKASLIRERVFLTRVFRSLTRETISLMRKRPSLARAAGFLTRAEVSLMREWVFRVREKDSPVRKIGRMATAGAVAANIETRQNAMANYDTPGLTYDSGALYDDLTPLPATTKKKMAKVKFSLKDVSDGDAIQTCSNLKTALTGNANFTTPPVSLSAFGTLITTAQTKLTASDNALAASKQATADKDAAITALAAAANQIAAYVDLTANGDESKILSAGLSIRAARAPQTVPAQVTNLSLTTSDNAGALDVHWDSLSGAKSFEVQSSPDPFTGTSWTTADMVTNSKTTLTGLTSGAKIWVRVRAINSAGKGAWSDVATKIVP